MLGVNKEGNLYAFDKTTLHHHLMAIVKAAAIMGSTGDFPKDDYMISMFTDVAIENIVDIEKKRGTYHEVESD